MNVWKPVDKLGAYALKYAPRLTTRVSLPLLRARKDTVPFTPFSKQFSESRAALVTTTGVHLRNQRPFDTASRAGDPTYREIPSSTPASELEIHHGHYDQADAEKDINVVFPIERMRELAADGIIGSLAKTFYGFMGYVMKFEQLERKYAPEVAGKLLLDNVDLVILTPGWLTCHQSVGLIARVIEAAGIPTVVVSLAREVTMQVKPPRAVCLRFPFGNPLGGPGNTEQQRTIIRDCLKALVEIDVPGTILEPGYRWRREQYGPVDWSELSG